MDSLEAMYTYVNGVTTRRDGIKCGTAVCVSVCNLAANTLLCLLRDHVKRKYALCI